MVAGVVPAAVAGCRVFGYLRAGEAGADTVGTGIGAGISGSGELRDGLGVGDGLLLGVGLGAGPGVRVVGDGEGVGDGVRLVVGDVGVGLGAGDADDVPGVAKAGGRPALGDVMADAAAKATGKSATAPATAMPGKVARSARAAQRRLAAADPGRRNLVLGILASKVTRAPAPPPREPLVAGESQ